MQQVVLVLFFLFGFAVQTNLDALEGDTLLINLKSGELCVTQHFFCDKNLPWYLPFTDVSDAEHFSTETYEVRVVTKGDTCVLPHQDPISLNLQDFTVCFYGLPLIIIANNMEEEQQIQNSLGIASSPGQPTIYQSKICTPFMSLGEGITTCYGTNSGESSVMSRAPCPEVNTDTYTLVSLTCDGEFIVTANSIVFAGTDITIIASSGIQFVSANRISWSGGGSLTFRTENRIAINASSSIDISSLLTLEAKQVQITAQEELELMNSFFNIISSGSVDLRSVTQEVTLERVTVAPLDSTVPIVVINSGPNVAWDAVTLSRFSCKATASISGHSTSGTGIVIRDSIFYHDLEATGYGCTGIKLEEENRFVSGTLTGYVTDSCASDGDNVYGFRGRSSGSILPLDGLTLLNMTVTGIVNTGFPFNPDRIGVFIENNCEWTAHNLTVIGSTNNAGIVDEYYADLSKGVSWIGNVEVEQHITQCNIIGTSDVGIGVYMYTPNLQYKANIEGNGGEIGIDISDYSFYDDTTLRGVGTDIGILVQGSSEYGYSEYEIFCIDDKTVIIDGTGETGVLFSDPYATNINFQITGNGTTNSIIMDEFHFVCDDISLAVSSITPGLIHFDLIDVRFSATNSVIQFLSPATVATLQIHGDDTKIYMKDGKIDDLILGLLPSVYMCGNYSIGLALSVNSELVATCAPSIGIGIGELIFHFHQEGDTIEMPLITGNVPLTIHSYMQNILFNEIGSQGDLQKCPTSLTVTVPSNKTITTQGNIYTNSYQYYSAPSFYQGRNSAIFRSMDSIYFDVDILDYRTVTIHAINCTFPSQLTGLAFNEGHKIIFDEPTTILMDGHVENVQIGMFEDGGGGGLPMAKAMDDIYLLGTGMIDNLEILTNSTFVIINPSPTAGGSSRFRVDNLSMTVGAELQLQMDILNNTFHSGFNLGINPVDTMQVKLISSRPITTSSQFDLVTVNNAASGALSLIDQNRTPIVLGSLLTPDLPAPNQFLVNTFSELLFSVILAPSPTPSSTSTRTRTPSLSRTPSATRPASPSIRPSSNSRTPLPESASISISISIPISISPSLRQSNPPISRSPSPTLLVAEPSITLRTSNAPTVVPPPTEIPSHQPSPSSTPVPVLIRPPSVIVPATAPSGVSIILSEPDPEVIAASDTTTVFSNVINLETPSPIALGGYVEICLEPEHENIDPDDLCLGFLDETKNPPEWKCQDSCLTRVETGLLCGETDHFTNFALLLDGNGNSGSSCTSSFNTYITGTWFGDFLLIIVSIIIVIVTLIVLVVLIDHFGPCTRFALGKEGYRVYLTRAGYKSNRGTIMNSSTFEDGNIMNNTGDGSMVNPVLA